MIDIYFLPVCFLMSALVFLISSGFIHLDATRSARKAHKKLSCFIFGLYWLSVPCIVLSVFFAVAENYNIQYEMVEKYQLLFTITAFLISFFILFKRGGEETTKKKTKEQK